MAARRVQFLVAQPGGLASATSDILSALDTLGGAALQVVVDAQTFNDLAGGEEFSFWFTGAADLFGWTINYNGANYGIQPIKHNGNAGARQTFAPPANGNLCIVTLTCADNGNWTIVVHEEGNAAALVNGSGSAGNLNNTNDVRLYIGDARNSGAAPPGIMEAVYVYLPTHTFAAEDFYTVDTAPAGATLVDAWDLSNYAAGVFAGENANNLTANGAEGPAADYDEQAGAVEFGGAVPTFTARGRVGMLTGTAAMQEAEVPVANAQGALMPLRGRASMSAPDPSFSARGRLGLLSGTATLATPEGTFIARGKLGLLGGRAIMSAPDPEFSARGRLGFLGGSATVSPESLPGFIARGRLGFLGGVARATEEGALTGLGATLGITWYVAGAFDDGADVVIDANRGVVADFNGLKYHHLQGVVGATVVLRVYLRGVPAEGITSATLEIQPRSDMAATVTKAGQIVRDGSEDGVAELTFTLDAADTLAIHTTRFFLDVNVSAGQLLRTPVVGATALTLA